MLGCSGGAEGPQEASLAFLDLGEERETARERSWPEITQQKRVASLRPPSHSQVGESQGLEGERPRYGGSAKHPPTH